MCSKALMSPVAMYSSLRRKPEPRCRPLVDALMTLDPGLRRNDVPGIMLCPDILEHRLSEIGTSELTAKMVSPASYVCTPEGRL